MPDEGRGIIGANAIACVCVCYSVCVGGGRGEERERKGVREGERKLIITTGD